MPRQRDSKGRFISNGNGKSLNFVSNEMLREMVFNATLGRRKIMDKLLDERRDIDDECGYPKDISPQQYKKLYDREPVATRVVQVLPFESWKVQPSVFETEETEQETTFEKAWSELDNNLRGDSWYQDEEGSPIWEYLRRADELSGIGQFGVILLGLDDGADLREPAEPSNGRKLVFLRCFDHSLVDIVRYENDQTNPRFGQPLAYNVTFNDPNDDASTGVGKPLTTVEVHWTRILHVADNLNSSEIFGTPRMRPVYNRLYDLRKLYGGSAEMYWRGAFPGLSLETHPQLGPNVNIDKSKLRDEMEQYMNTLQRYFTTSGMTAKMLSPTVVDPSPQINTQLEAICIRLGIPKRIFTGSERGELASSQDDSTWNERLRDRQVSYITPRIIVPFIDRLIVLGVLPEPEGYSVVWPDLGSMSEQEKADVALRKTESMAKYVGGNVDQLITPVDYLTRILGMPDEEAMEVVESAEERIDEGVEDEPEENLSPFPGGDQENEGTVAEGAGEPEAGLPDVGGA